MFQNYGAVLTAADMTLHIYCHPNTYRDVRVPHADNDAEIISWNRADTGEDDPNAAEVTAPTPEDYEEDEDAAKAVAREFAENQKDMKDRKGSDCM